jgi:hypothetical protein
VRTLRRLAGGDPRIMQFALKFTSKIKSYRRDAAAQKIFISTDHFSDLILQLNLFLNKRIATRSASPAYSVSPARFSAAAKEILPSGLPPQQELLLMS